MNKLIVLLPYPVFNIDPSRLGNSESLKPSAVVTHDNHVGRYVSVGSLFVLLADSRKLTSRKTTWAGLQSTMVSECFCSASFYHRKSETYVLGLWRNHVQELTLDDVVWF
jgi:hypothetical protein